LQLSGEVGDFEFGVLPSTSPSSGSKIEKKTLPLPILRRKNVKETNGTDFLFIFECEYLPQPEIQIHDHTIVLGSVRRVLTQPTADGTSSFETTKDDFCLTYADTHFWKMGEQI
jgi:hypothetical protein